MGLTRWRSRPTPAACGRSAWTTTERGTWACGRAPARASPVTRMRGLSRGLTRWRSRPTPAVCGRWARTTTERGTWACGRAPARASRHSWRTRPRAGPGPHTFRAGPGSSRFHSQTLATGPPVCRRQVVPKWYHNSVAMNLRLDEEDSALLKALAEAEHVSLHEAVLRAIRRSAREVAHTARVREATAEMQDRWGEVLGRLGRA